MVWFWKRKDQLKEEAIVAERAAVEIMDMRKQIDHTSEQAKQDIAKLNKLLKTNDVTLKIYIATRRN